MGEDSEDRTLRGRLTGELYHIAYINPAAFPPDEVDSARRELERRGPEATENVGTSVRRVRERQIPVPEIGPSSFLPENFRLAPLFASVLILLGIIGLANATIFANSDFGLTFRGADIRIDLGLVRSVMCILVGMLVATAFGGRK
ncbi:MAG TPA: hypothetical protein VFR81_01155 [Longimicrobium sp.]|nr:hypothetical protein [Longimicrobium sp.]